MRTSALGLDLARPTRGRWRFGRFAAALLAASWCAAACDSGNQGAYARRIGSAKDLIGGPKALGAVGDWLIGNEKIRVVVQDQGWSRGFGIFGGGVIDADLVRPDALGGGAGGNGRDNFGELFPALFLQAFDVEEQRERDVATNETVTLPGIEIIADGSDGGPAILRTRASGGDFLTTVQSLVEAVVPQQGLRFETDYILKPGARHLEIVGRLRNVSTRPLDLSGAGIGQLLGVDAGFQVPLGDVALFGAGNTVFAPGAVTRLQDPDNPRPAGFDLRFSVEAAYRVPRSLPALPGLVVDFLATAGREVSYGFAVAESERNYVWLNKAEFERDPQVSATKHSMLVPFIVSAFAGAYYDVPPDVLAPRGQDGDTYETRKYFIVGSGDVASVRDELYRIRGEQVGRFEGRVQNALTGAPEPEAWVHVLDSRGRPYSQVKTNADGRFRCDLAPGAYRYRVTAPGRFPYPRLGELERETTFGVATGESTYRLIRIPAGGELEVTILDEVGRKVPGKVSVVGTYQEAFDGQQPMDFLFDFSLGEERRPTDLSYLSSAPSKSRRFLETVVTTPDGFVRTPLRPTPCNGEVCMAPYAGPYDIVVSRGPEYATFTKTGVYVREGERIELTATLRRAMDTSGYVSADFHTHAINSADSSMQLTDRVAQAAAEGVEILVATDHNYLTDLQPTIARLGVQDWVTSFVGVELSTLEMGHFNGFPLRYDLEATTHFPFVESCFPPQEEKSNRTSFDWVQCAPAQLFAGLRELGELGPERTVVQVNHPRDSILGYMNQYFVNPYTGLPAPPIDENFPGVDFIAPRNLDTGQFELDRFSLEFDAIEVVTGKRFDTAHAFRVPADAPAETVARLQDHRCNRGHPENGAGKVLLRQGGYIAYPGAIDDWLNLLNQGYAFTATGNSDSHGGPDELGYPRNYVRVGDPTGHSPPGVVDAAALVDAVKGHRVVLGNGPLLELEVHTAATSGVGNAKWPVGSTVAFPVSVAGQAQTVAMRVRTPPWLDVDRLVLYANAVVLDEIAVPPGADGRGQDFVVEKAYVFSRDTVLVAEARGSRSMFPIVTPNEDPPTNIGSALGAIAGNLGLGASFGSSDGTSSPSYVQSVFPFALTNPIWLDVDANGRFDAPGPATLGPGPAPDERCPALSLPQREPAVMRLLGHSHEAGQRFHRADVRKIFAAHGGHAH